MSYPNPSDFKNSEQKFVWWILFKTGAIQIHFLLLFDLSFFVVPDILIFNRSSLMTPFKRCHIFLYVISIFGECCLKFWSSLSQILRPVISCLEFRHPFSQGRASFALKPPISCLAVFHLFSQGRASFALKPPISYFELFHPFSQGRAPFALNPFISYFELFHPFSRTCPTF